MFETIKDDKSNQISKTRFVKTGFFTEFPETSTSKCSKRPKDALHEKSIWEFSLGENIPYSLHA